MLSNTLEHVLGSGFEAYRHTCYRNCRMSPSSDATWGTLQCSSLFLKYAHCLQQCQGFTSMEVGNLFKAHYMKPHPVDVPRLYNNYTIFDAYQYVIIDG